VPSVPKVFLEQVKEKSCREPVIAHFTLVLSLIGDEIKIKKSFIQYGSWNHTITIKYKYKLDNKKHKNIVKGTPELTVSNGN